MARPRRACWARAAHQKHLFFIGERKNAHRAQARAHFSKCAPRAGESSILSTQHGVSDPVNEQNEHRTMGRGHHSQSKCAPRASESSIFPTQDGAHDLASKENEHRAEARAPFSTKMCTVRKREAQKCSNGAAKVAPLQRRALYKSQFGPA